MFAEEKPRLLSLPEQLPETELVTPVRVDTTAFVRFGTNLYRVPPRYARRTITLVASDREIRVLDGANAVANHERSWGEASTDRSTRTSKRAARAEAREALRPGPLAC